MPSLNTFVDGTLVSAAPLNENFTTLNTAITAKLSSPVGNSNLQNKLYECLITVTLSATDLTAATGTVKYFGGIPSDTTDGTQQYVLKSVGILGVTGGTRTTAAIFSIQVGSPTSWTNLVTGVTIPVTSSASCTTVGTNISTGTASSPTAFLRTNVTQQGVGFTGSDTAVLVLKFSRVNGLRS